MKILKIELQNLNSLKSETPLIIDFEQAQFKDVGLYAITGSTGAGKTTILDAITIGLYHQVPRFNKSNIKAGLIDVVSYGANDALSRITFESNNQKFEAQWALRVSSKTGKALQKPVESVRFKNLTTDKILAEKKTDVQQKIIETTQLTYDQFLRSVMLAQGEFAAFLSANAKDKGKLLEQITGEEIYKKIGNTISDRLYEEKKTLDSIKSKINTEDLLSEADKNSLLLEKERVNTLIQQLEKDIAHHNFIKDWYNKQNTLLKQEHELAHAFEHLNKLKIESSDHLKDLSNHELALVYKPDLLEIARITSECKTNQDKVKDIDGQITQLNKDVLTYKSQSESLLTLHKNTELEFNTWLPKLELVSKLDTQITHENTLSLDLKNRLTLNHTERSTISKSQTDRSNQITKIANQLKKTQDQIEQKKNVKAFESYFSEWNKTLTTRKHLLEHQNEIQNELATLQNKLVKEENELRSLKKKQVLSSDVFKEKEKELNTLNDKLKAYSIEELIKKSTTFDTDTHQWKKQQSNVLQVIKNKEESLNLERDLNLLEQAVKTIKTTLDHTLTLKSQKEESIHELQKVIDLTQVVEQFSEERKKLEQNKPCALCGSLTHPYVDAYTLPKLNIEKEKLQTKQLELNKLIQSESQYLQELGINKTKQEGLKKDILKLKDLNTELTTEIQHIYTGDKPLTLEIIESALHVLTKEKNKLQEKINLHQEQKSKKEQIEKEFVLIKQQLVDNDQQTGIINQRISSNTERQNAVLKQLNENQIEVNRIEENLHKAFTDLHIQIPTLEKTDYFLNRLKGSIEAFNILTKQEEQFNTTIKQLQVEVDMDTKVIQKLEETNKDLQDQLNLISQNLSDNTKKRIEFLPMSISIDQKRNELNAIMLDSRTNYDKAEAVRVDIEKKWVIKQQEVKNLNESISHLLILEKEKNNLLTKHIESSIFTSVDDIKTALLPNDIADKYTVLKQKIQTKETQLNTLKQQIESQKATLVKDKTFDLTEDQNRIQLSEKSTLFQEHNRQLGSITTKFNLDEQIIKRNKHVVEEINNQDLTYQKWSKLLTLIGGSKHAFNTYVQRLTLKNLIQLANIHLYKLNKRYSLKMEDVYKPGEELNFKLVDHYQTDITRYVDTSSGGEKFLISLSLALGLSDLSNHNVQIKSLFIDEGFGTLDNSTLELVLTTLETLQAQGKMIGIISHIENLKDRIPTQIQVIKKSSGVSTLNIS